MKFNKVTHVIFDLDGLILDSEYCYGKIMEKLAKRYGKVYTPEVKLKILGTTEVDTVNIFIKELEIPASSEEMLQAYYALIAQEVTHAPFMPGAKRLIRHLSKHNIPIAVATSSGRKRFDLKTQYYQEIFSLFDHIVCGTNNPEVEHGKPAPDIFLVCASRFPDNPHPEQVLVFEDAPNGARAGLLAEMQTVFVPDKNVYAPQMRKDATLVLNSLEEFDPELFGLPPFDE